MKSSTFAYTWAFASLLSLPAFAWLPGGTIRGVNLGGLFVSEQWMMNDEWNSMGCQGANDEWACVVKLGQDAANSAFQHHYDTWITQSDIQRISSLGLNTVRVPVGYWMIEDLIANDEYFPRGGLPYLKRLCQWASDEGLYVIIDLHAAPGGQTPDQQFTGRSTSNPGFFNDNQYERAYQFLETMTDLIHTDPAFSTVGTIEVLNEPWRDSSIENSLIYDFYPTAWKRIRDYENNQLNIPDDKKLHIQMMDARWGAGDPTSGLADTSFALFDDHRYYVWDTSVDTTRDAYISRACSDDVGGNSPLIVGEWSLATRDSENSEFTIDRADAKEWYRKWFYAQILAYEKQQGWVFWTWKVNWIGGKEEWRWGYQNAVDAGVIPENLDPEHAGVCNGAN